MVFEEDEEIGEPERCAGLLSLAGLEKLGIPARGKYLQNLVKGAVIKGVSGRSRVIDAGRPIAAVVSRRLLDKELARRAERAGARIVCGVRVKKVMRCGEPLILETAERSYCSRWVIDAEGAGAALLRRLTGVGTDFRKWVPIIQLIVEGHDLDRRFVYIFLKRYLPDFFAYLIPVDEGIGKLGIASRTPTLRRLLERFIREELPGIRPIHLSSHVIYTGYPIDSTRFFSSRFIPVGDAAGHVKATTGGGVVMGGLISAEIASAVAASLRGGSPGRFLREARRIIWELRRIALLRRLLGRMSSPYLEPLISLATSGIGEAYLSRRGDMDFQVSSLIGSRH